MERHQSFLVDGRSIVIFGPTQEQVHAIVDLLNQSIEGRTDDQPEQGWFP